MFSIMSSLIEVDDLQAFFGGIHRQLYPDEQETYGTHRFELLLKGDRIVCDYLPGEGELHLLWWTAEKLAIDLKLENVRSLEVSRSGGEQTLIGNVDAQNLRQLFKFQVRPHVSLRWSSATFFGE
jgi:hypothetical protein